MLNRGLVAGLMMDLLGPLGDIIDLISAVIGKNVSAWIDNGFKGTARSLSWWKRIKMGVGGATRALGGAFAALAKIKEIKRKAQALVRAAKAKKARAAAEKARGQTRRNRTTCFAHGTLVLLAGGGLVPIESVELGLAVAAHDERALERADLPDGVCPDQHAWIDPQDWLRLVLEATDEAGRPLRAELLRPRAWVERRRVSEGGDLWLESAELGLSAWSRIVELAPCPPVASREAGGWLVTGRYLRLADDLLEVSLDGTGPPLLATATHPFYSERRGTWVRAGALEAGEPIRTAHGRATVLGVQARPGTHPVANLEVHRAHTYFVGERGLLVHNTHGDGRGKPNTPKSSLPRAQNGDYLPDPQATGPHSTLGTRVGKDGNPYTQGATFDGNGRFQGRTDVTNHGRRDHPCPHFHPATSPNSVGPFQPVK